MQISIAAALSASGCSKSATLDMKTVRTLGCLQHLLGRFFFCLQAATGIGVRA